MEGEKGENDRKLAGQRGVAFFSPALGKVVSMDIKDRVFFTKEGNIVDNAKKSLDDRYKEYHKKYMENLGKILSVLFFGQSQKK
jgi:hypothetical protein